MFSGLQGAILSGPADFPTFRDLLACEYSSMKKGPSSMSKFTITSGPFSSGSSTAVAFPRRFLKWESQVFFRSLGLLRATWPRKGFFLLPLISFITPLRLSVRSLHPLDFPPDLILGAGCTLQRVIF